MVWYGMVWYGMHACMCVCMYNSFYNVLLNSCEILLLANHGQTPQQDPGVVSGLLLSAAVALLCVGKLWPLSGAQDADVPGLWAISFWD